MAGSWLVLQVASTIRAPADGPDPGTASTHKKQLFFNSNTINLSVAEGTPACLRNAAPTAEKTKHKHGSRSERTGNATIETKHTSRHGCPCSTKINCHQLDRGLQSHEKPILVVSRTSSPHGFRDQWTDVGHLNLMLSFRSKVATGTSAPPARSPSRRSPSAPSADAPGRQTASHRGIVGS